MYLLTIFQQTIYMLSYNKVLNASFTEHNPYNKNILVIGLNFELMGCVFTPVPASELTILHTTINEEVTRL